MDVLLFARLFKNILRKAQLTKSFTNLVGGFGVESLVYTKGE